MSYVTKLNVLRETGIHQYRDHLDDDERDGDRLRLEVLPPRFDLLRPRQSLQRRRVFDGVDAACYADEMKRREEIAKYENARAAETAKQESAHRQLRQESAIAERSRSALSSDSVKAAVGTIAEANRLAVIVSNSIRKLEELPFIDEEIRKHNIEMQRRVCKAKINDLEIAALGFDPEQLGGVT